MLKFHKCWVSIIFFDTNTRSHEKKHDQYFGKKIDNSSEKPECNVISSYDIEFEVALNPS